MSPKLLLLYYVGQLLLLAQSSSLVLCRQYSIQYQRFTEGHTALEYQSQKALILCRDLLNLSILQNSESQSMLTYLTQYYSLQDYFQLYRICSTFYSGYQLYTISSKGSQCCLSSRLPRSFCRRSSAKTLCCLCLSESQSLYKCSTCSRILQRPLFQYLNLQLSCLLVQFFVET